jgi:hypothetical protein
VITPEGVVEFVDNRKGIQVVDFDQMSEAALRVRGSSSSDSMIVNLEVWLDLRFHDGRKQKWRSSGFSEDYRTIQCVLEAYGAYKVLRGMRFPRFSGVFEDWFDPCGPGRKALLPAPRKYPDELRERAVRLYRESEPRPTFRRLGQQLNVHRKPCATGSARPRPTPDSGTIDRPPRCSPRTDG